MRTMHLRKGLHCAALLALSACGQQETEPGPAALEVAPTEANSALEPFYEQRLAARQIDYFRALRIASLKLRGSLPTLAEIRELQASFSPGETYAAIIRRILDGKRADGTDISPHPVLPQMQNFWRNTLVLDAPPNADIGASDRESAPLFAAMVTLSDTRPYTQLFDSNSNECWTLNGSGVPTMGACACTGGTCFTGAAPNAGIIANPAFQAANYGNMSFHRVRMIQEIFVCRPMPAEPSGIWDATYTPPVGGVLPATPIQFSSTDSVVCANCHQTINKQAPLFSTIDDKGVTRACADPATCDYQVMVPVSPVRAMRLADLLVLSNGVPQLGWRAGAPAGNLSQFGSAMAADPEVARCMVSRLWYFLMSRREIAIDPVRPPSSMVNQWLAVLNASTDPISGAPRAPKTLKAVLLSMLTSDDFVRF